MTKKLTGFEQHGVHFTDKTDSQAIGACPFCGSRNKFFVRMDESVLWDCKICGETGNFNQFLEKINNEHKKKFKGAIVKSLSIDRNLKPNTLRFWGVGWSGLFYSVPVFGNPKKKMTDIRRYTIGKRGLSTTGGKTSFMIPKDFSDTKNLWLCEGEWDGAATWEFLRDLKISDDVIATPGANNFSKESMSMFEDKNVIVCYDNDEAGIKGAIKVYKMIGAIVSDFKFVHWPDEMPDKFDMRDYFNTQDEPNAVKLTNLRKMLHSTPPIDKTAQKPTETEVKETTKHSLDGEGISVKEVEERFRKWLTMRSTESLDVMFGSIFANRMSYGDPLWLFMVNPSGGMKSALLMSLSDSPLISELSSLTPQSLMSGASMMGGADPSLIPRLDKKVLVIKDFTTIMNLQHGAQEEIFGVLRDAFDGEIRKTFGNGVVRKYKSKFGILAGVTPAIEELLSSNNALGARFLKFRMGRGKDLGEKDAIRRTAENFCKQGNMRDELRQVSKEVLKRNTVDLEPPKIPDEIFEKLILLSDWAAKLRGSVSRERYTRQIQFMPTPEVGTRIINQLLKLAHGICVYRGETEISVKTYQTLLHVAQDTVPDIIEVMVRNLFINYDSKTYSGTVDICNWTRLPTETVKVLLQDLALLKIITKEPGRLDQWRLSGTVHKTMEEIGMYSEFTFKLPEKKKKKKPPKRRVKDVR